jgi:GlpG protein
MREIGTLSDENNARLFSDFLYAQGIENRIELENDAWNIWIFDEEEIQQAKELLREFSNNPEKPLYRKIASQAKILKKEEKRREKKDKSQPIDVRIRWYSSRPGEFGKFTLILIIISVLVGIYTRLGDTNRDLIALMQMTNTIISGDYVQWRSDLPEIQSGQIWRFITPIFLHFGFFHILFNMLWLKDLGSMIENKKGTLYFTILVIALAIISNSAQYFVSGPFFGGMSGVVYGLLGYLWMKTKFDPDLGMFLSQTTVIFMIAWFFICLSGLVGNIANTAHGAGAVMGIAWGYLTSSHFKRKFRNR